jgi:low temperature requirement protein LtrA
VAEHDAPRSPRLTAAPRTGGRVMPLELFFDLVFVLALTQCTALMAAQPTWQGLARGLLALAILWWAWVGYAWLTSVVDPEEGGVRLVIIAAMAAMLVVALAIPEAFEERGLLFAGGLAVVRIAHIVLFLIASRGDPNLRSSVIGLAVSTALGVGIIAAASFTDGVLQGGLWALALMLDMGGPAFFGAEHGIDAGVVVAAVLGVCLSAAMWWLYFDVVALVAARRLQNATRGRERNQVARDSFSFLHLPMVGGIALVALGFKKTLEHVGDALQIEIAVAMLGGFVLYLLAHVAFRWRNVHRFSTQRVVAAVVLAALTPVAVEIPAEATLAVALLVFTVLIVYENRRFAELRDRLRHRVETT